MEEALSEAQSALGRGEIPVGCVAVIDGEIVSRTGNDRENSFDPTGHAEIIALRESGAKTESRVLTDVTLYVTLEPCPMCMSAIMMARVGRLVYGASDSKLGAVKSRWNLPNEPAFGHSLRVTSGVLENECADILHRFFEHARRK